MARGSTLYDDYWKEFHDIENNHEEEIDEEFPKTPDEGEQEAAWLKEAGYEFIVNALHDGKDLSADDIEALTETLTTHQAAVVKRRVDTLNATIRKKQKNNKTDVRDIFKTQSWGGSPPQNRQSEVDGPIQRGGSKGHERYSFAKNKGGYSMSGRRTENVADKMATGVEVLSVQPRGTFRQTSFTSNRASMSHPLPSISDEDVAVDFKISEPTPSKERAPVIMERKELRDNLPDFDIQPDPLGNTLIADLSPLDLDHLKSLTLIELTALFDNNNILWSRRKAKKKFKENGLFGVPLETLVEHDQQVNPSCKVPMVFLDIIKFLEKHCLDIEGILRVPGSTSRIKVLRQELEEKFYQGTFSWVDVMPNDAAALLKQFLRELPSPLLTPQYIEGFAEVENIPDRQLQLQALNLLILLLPDINRNTLSVLLKFLSKIVSHKDKNLMGLNNVAMIMAPNLFLLPMSRSKTKTIDDLEINMAAGTSNVVRMLIKYQRIIWMVPSFLLQQMRHKNELEQQRKGREKHKMKFLGKKDKSDVYKKPVLHEGDFDDGVIRVQAPHLTKSCQAIRLDPNMLAGDIVNKFRKTSSNGRDHKSYGKKSGHGKIVVDPNNVQFAQDNTYLYEVGGNIGERRLSHNTHMLTLYKVNPNAEWIIKTIGQT